MDSQLLATFSNLSDLQHHNTLPTDQAMHLIGLWGSVDLGLDQPSPQDKDKTDPEDARVLQDFIQQSAVINQDKTIRYVAENVSKVVKRQVGGML